MPASVSPRSAVRDRLPREHHAPADPRPAEGPVASAPVGLEPAIVAGREPTIGVSVLVPVRDEERHLPETVAAMRAQELDGTVELVFVDGRSRDRTVAVLRELQAVDPRIRILDNPGRTVTHGLNVGLRAARGTYVARMDAHTRYPPDYLRRGIERLRHGDVDWVSGPQVPVGTGYWSGLVARALSGPLGRGSSDKWQAAEDAPGEPREWDLSTSVFTGVWRRDTLDQLGGWDPQWTVNEDSEMAARVHARGGRIVCRSEMAARYAPRDALSALARQYWRYGSFRARTFARHPTSCGPLRAGASLLPLGLAAALVPRAADRATGVPIGRAGRMLAGLYALAVAGQVARLRPRPADAAPLAAVLATMHLSWGTGFLSSALRVLPRRARIRADAPTPLSRPVA